MQGKLILKYVLLKDVWFPLRRSMLNWVWR